MQVVEHHLSVPTRPSGRGVLVPHSWWGLNPFFKRLCGRFSARGFVALAPDLYGGKVATTQAKEKSLRAESASHRGYHRGHTGFWRSSDGGIVTNGQAAHGYAAARKPRGPRFQSLADCVISDVLRGSENSSSAVPATGVDGPDDGPGQHTDDHHYDNSDLYASGDFVQIKPRFLTTWMGLGSLKLRTSVLLRESHNLAAHRLVDGTRVIQ